MKCVGAILERVVWTDGLFLSDSCIKTVILLLKDMPPFRNFSFPHLVLLLQYDSGKTWGYMAWYKSDGVYGIVSKRT